MLKVKYKKMLLALLAIAVVVVVLIAMFPVNKSGKNLEKVVEDNQAGPLWETIGEGIASDPDALEEDANIIAKVRYTGESETYMPDDPGLVKTAYVVDVIEVLKGSVSKRQIEIVGNGGTVSLKEYVDNASEEDLEDDPDLAEMSEKELKETSHKENTFGVNLKKGDIAIVYLEKFDGEYRIAFFGLGLFEENKDGEYVNPQNELVVDKEIIEEIEEERRKK